MKGMQGSVWYKGYLGGDRLHKQNMQQKWTGR